MAQQDSAGASPSAAGTRVDKSTKFRAANARTAATFAPILEPGEKIELFASGLTSRWWAIAEWLIIPTLLGLPARATRHVLVTDRSVYVCRGASNKTEVLTKRPRSQTTISGRREVFIQPDMHRGFRGIRLQIGGSETVHVRPTSWGRFDAEEMLRRLSATASA